jgi:L-ribulokinase
MARLKEGVYEPNPDHAATYDVLYREYVRLHDYFGRGENDVMKTLRGLRARALADLTLVEA